MHWIISSSIQAPQMGYILLYNIIRQLASGLLFVISFFAQRPGPWSFFNALEIIAEEIYGPATMAALSPAPATLLSDLKVFVKTAAGYELKLPEAHRVLQQLFKSTPFFQLSVSTCYRSSLYPEDALHKLSPSGWAEVLLGGQPVKGRMVHALPSLILKHFDEKVCPMVHERFVGATAFILMRVAFFAVLALCIALCWRTIIKLPCSIGRSLLLLVLYIVRVLAMIFVQLRLFGRSLLKVRIRFPKFRRRQRVPMGVLGQQASQADVPAPRQLESVEVETSPDIPAPPQQASAEVQASSSGSPAQAERASSVGVQVSPDTPAPRQYASVAIQAEQLEQAASGLPAATLRTEAQDIVASPQLPIPQNNNIAPEPAATGEPHVQAQNIQPNRGTYPRHDAQQYNASWPPLYFQHNGPASGPYFHPAFYGPHWGHLGQHIQMAPSQNTQSNNGQWSSQNNMPSTGAPVNGQTETADASSHHSAEGSQAGTTTAIESSSSSQGAIAASYSGQSHLSEPAASDAGADMLQSKAGIDGATMVGINPASSQGAIAADSSGHSPTLADTNANMPQPGSETTPTYGNPIAPAPVEKPEKPIPTQPHQVTQLAAIEEAASVEASSSTAADTQTPKDSGEAKKSLIQQTSGLEPSEASSSMERPVAVALEKPLQSSDAGEPASSRTNTVLVNGRVIRPMPVKLTSRPQGHLGPIQRVLAAERSSSPPSNWEVVRRSAAWKCSNSACPPISGNTVLSWNTSFGATLKNTKPQNGPVIFGTTTLPTFNNDPDTPQAEGSDGEASAEEEPPAQNAEESNKKKKKKKKKKK